MITSYSFGQDYNGNNRNVADKYKEWVNAEIRADLQKNRSECVQMQRLDGTGFMEVERFNNFWGDFY